jgi:ABC-2 type transport system permease protein
MNSPLKMLRLLFATDLLVLLKNKRAILAGILVPLYMLFIINRTGGKLGGADYLASVALVIIIGIMITSISVYPQTVARDRERGVFQRLRVTPAPTWTIMTSRLLVQVIANFVITLIVLVVAGLQHHLPLGIDGYVTVLLVATLGGMMFLSIGQTFAGLVKSAATVSATANLLYLVLLLSGILGPLGVLGTTYQNITQWTPVGTIITVLAGALHQTAWNGHMWWSLAACFGYISVCSFIGIKWFQWEAR